MNWSQFLGVVAILLAICVIPVVYFIPRIGKKNTTKSTRREQRNSRHT